MPITKEQVKEAFREVMALKYSDVRPEEEIEHEFSTRFYEKMAELINSMKESQTP